MKQLFSFSNHRGQHRRQEGVAAVEFALVAVILFTLLLGIMEMGRILFMMNTTAEATRLGARLAVVCDQNDPSIKNKMTNLASFLPAGNIDVNYLPGGCDINTCRYVTVSISGVDVQAVVPLIPVNFEMPPFSTTLPRESMTSLNNPVCS